MTALFTLDVATDQGVDWQIGTPADINGLLAERHYLGPLRAGGHALILAGAVDHQVVAAQVWRRPTSRRLPNDGSWLELSRWCLTPEAGLNAGSRMHKYATRTIKEKFPNCTTLVSYSDPAHGHTGALYRASNWVWRPTWLRLRPPPSSNGMWQPGRSESVKDRWVFPLRKDKDREQVVRVDDDASIRYWLANRTENETRFAKGHPQLDAGETA